MPTTLPDHLREFDDVPTMRRLVYDNALEGLRTRFPMSDGVHKLELLEPRYSGPQEFSLAQQKRAMMTGRSLNSPITGKWRLTDEASGKVLEEREDQVMQVPYMTQRGTFIYGGNDYIVSNQARMRPGVYTRTKGNGDHEAQFNVRPGTAPSFRVWMEPATGIFRVNVGQANIPMYPLFKALGVGDEAMRKAWGDDVYDANVKKTDKMAVDKLYTKFAGYKAEPGASYEDKLAAIREYVGKAELDPWVTGRTLGIEAANVTPEVLMRTTGKLLNINRGEEDVDDRDAPKFSNVLSVEDFVKERIEKDAGKTARNLLWKIKRDRTLKRVGRNALNPYMRTLLLDSGLAQSPQETNPLDLADQLHRIVKLGEGGIGSAEAITDSARDVNPGQVGFIDTVAGPESEKAGVDVRTAFHTYKGRDQQLYAEFKDVNGNVQYLRPEDMEGKVLAFPNQEDEQEVHALKDGQMVHVPLKDVDYWVPSFGHMNAATINMTPMATGFMPTRQFYAAKYWSQYMPMVHGEVPLVQPVMPDGKDTFNEHYGRKYAGLPAPAGGIVTRITNDGITLTDDEGKKHVVELAKDFSYNRMTAVSYAPTVQEGDVVKFGDTVAHSNFNDKATGAFNMGVNLKTAVVPYRGKSFEDAMVLSESAARKLATERLIGLDKDQGRGIKIHRNKFISAFPREFTTSQLDNIDEFGVVKQGAELKKGDPVILALGPKLLSAEDAQLGNLHKVLRNSFRNESVVWEANDPGVVTDVALTARGAKVNVKSVGNVQPGDKLCYSPDTEVLTDAGWVPVGNLTTEQRIATLANDRELIYLSPSAIHRKHYDGRMYHVVTTQVDLMVTDYHRLYARPRTLKAELDHYSLIPASDLFGRRYRMKKNAEWLGQEVPFINLPDVPNRPCGQGGVGTTTCPGYAVMADALLKFLGIYIAEGSCTEIRNDQWVIALSAVKPRERQFIEQLMAQLGVHAYYNVAAYVIHNLVLAKWLLAQGVGSRAHVKHLPSWVFSLSARQCRVLLDALSAGDGCVGDTGWLYFTSSRQLADDVQRLALHAGLAANVGQRNDNEIGRIVSYNKDGKPIIQRHDAYVVSIYRNKFYPQVNHGHRKMQNGQLEEWLDYCGEVVCPEMPEHHVIYVRRNGKAVWSGNCNQFSSKGVVSQVLPDEDMPMDVATGERYEMLFNPMTVLSRMAPNQLLELQLAKIAKATGKPYRLPQTPPKEGWAKFTANELAKAGLPDSQSLYDPKTGRTIPNVTDGYAYISAFHHLAEQKLCVSDDTEVLTADGWKPVTAVAPDDLVLTLNPYSLEDEWQHPTAINVYDVDGEVVHVEDEDQDLLGTLDHQFYFRHYPTPDGVVDNVRIPGGVLLDDPITP